MEKFVSKFLHFIKILNLSNLKSYRVGSLKLNTADFPHNLYKEIDMLKFFVTDFSWIEGMNDTGSYYGLCFPEEAEVLSFCRRENAEVLARKISERREEWSTEEVRYHSSCIYAIDVPDNWNGEDIALWLFDAIERNEITPVS